MKCILYFLFLMFSVCSYADEYQPDIYYKLQWSASNGSVNDLNIFLKYNQLHVEATNRNLHKKLWSLNDYVQSCNLDVELNIIPDSLEAIDLFGNGDFVVLFAYKIGCIGGIDPVDVKYFAFYKGQKYALRGIELFISNDGVDEGYNPPIPSYNLKSNKILFNYMQGRWSLIATRIMF
ncbi:hypothetical protein FDX19_21875 [Citrobacter sp. wls619]|uniref:M949_RS01915 family surface polysaccharide biosynthesis protein n=1 Tax=Citrobacter sp. wls619 TaxID=2576432 RepID=UPI0010CA11AA|nr:hypothetical protein [Citrobacter sp. wls619]TKV05701.1 hypothetical protein FDX19_21875 [Citrobacter sp. wls619]